MRINGIIQCVHIKKSICLLFNLIYSFHPILHTHTHKKCKKFYITMWDTYNTRTQVIFKKKMHTLKFVSTVTLYLKVKSPRSSTDKIVAFIAIEKSSHLKQMKTTKPWKNTYKLISRRRTHLKLNSDKCTCIF